MSRIDLSTAFGLVLRRRREDAGISQEDLAHEAGMTRNYVSLLERGQRNASLNVVARLAAALGTSAGTLVKAAESKQSKKRGS